MRKLLPLVSIALATLLPSCFVYDESLLGEDDGNPSVGGGSNGTGGSDSGGDGGGLSQSGGSTGGGTPGVGGSGDGGTPGGGGTTSGGGNGAGGSTGGGTGTGCYGAFTDVNATFLLDDFNTDWRSIGDGTEFTGSWSVSNDSTGTGISPTVADWGYEADTCAGAEDTALHIVGTNYSTWGASYDATLMVGVTEVDLSDYDGVVFWARSDATPKNQIKLGITATGSPVAESTPRVLTAAWKQYKIPFPSGPDATKVKAVQFVAAAVAAGDSFDIWIDDVHFYN